MKKLAVLLIALVMCSFVFISGCTESSTIKSQEEVSEAVTNISQDVGELTEALEDIDESLGS